MGLLLSEEQAFVFTLRQASLNRVSSSRMLKKSASSALASLRGSTRGTCGGKELIRSHVIEASGSSEVGYVPPRLFVRCGVACGTVRLGAPGWAGENRGHLAYPAVSTPSELFDRISVVVHVYTEFFRSLLDRVIFSLEECLMDSSGWHIRLASVVLVVLVMV